MPRVAKQPQPPLERSGRPLLVLRNPLPRQTFSARQLNNRPLVYSAVELILLRPRLLVLLVPRILLSLPLQLRPPCSGGTGAFGQTQPQQTSAFGGGTGAFGQTQQQQPQQQTSIFGGGGGAFGSTANKPSPFGAGKSLNPFC